MPTPLINSVVGMLEKRGQTVDRYGRDQTGQIQYRFNEQGFRAEQTLDFIPDYAFFGASLVAGIGVSVEKTFASQFNNSHNYGLCGKYLNESSFNHIKQFIQSPLFHKKIKMAVFWTDRDVEYLDDYYHNLTGLPLIHFFCGTPLPYSRCYRMVPNLDYDASNTHIGPVTHKFIYKLLCDLFNQL